MFRNAGAETWPTQQQPKENYDSLGFDTAVSTAYIHENILLSFIFCGS